MGCQPAEGRDWQYRQDRDRQLRPWADQRRRPQQHVVHLPGRTAADTHTARRPSARCRVRVGSINFDAPAPFNDTEAIKVINGIVKTGDIPKGTKPNQYTSAADNYGYALGIMKKDGTK